MRILTALFLVTACANIKVNDDPSPAANSSQYATAEFIACNRVWHGLGVCLKEAGQAFTFQVQTYHEGVLSYSFDSEQGTIHSEVYKGSELIDIALPEDAKTVSFIVTPEIKDSPVATYSLSGYLYVTEKKRTTDIYTIKAPEGSKVSIKVASEKPSVQSFITGCGLDSEDTLTAVNGHVTFTHPKLPVRTSPCIITAGIKSGTYQKSVLWMVEPYKKDFVPLPIPDVIAKNGRITITGDKTTAITGVDRKFVIDSNLQTNFNASQSHIVRAATVKGRSVIGIYTPGKGFEWLQ